MAADGTTIDALVLGSGHNVYQQSIRLQRGRNGRLQVHGLCSCPVGFNCKHVAAVLLEYQARTHTNPGLIGRTPPLVGSAGARTRPSKSGASQATSVETKPAALPREIDAWLRSLDAAQQEDSEDYPLTVRKRLLYVIEQGAHSGGLMVHLQSIELRRDDVPSGIATPHQAAQLLRSGQQPKFLRPSDRKILVQLTNTGAEGSEGFIITLQAIIATGRGRWGRWDGPTLTEGPAVSGAMEWQLGDNASQSPVLILPDNLRTLRLTRPWYVDPATGVMGPIETGLPSRLVRTLLAAPAVPPNLVERLRTEIDRRWPGHAVPVPRVLAAPEPLRTAMQPHLLLRAAELPFDPAAILSSARYRHVSSTGTNPVSLIRLSWRYGPITIPSGTPFQPHPIVQHDGKLFQLQRDPAAEEQVAATLDEFGFQRLDRFHVLPDSDPHCRDLALLDPDPGAWLEFVLHDVPCLRREGWIIDVADDFPLRLAEPSGDIDIMVTETSGVDWFDVDLGVMIDGQRIGLVPALFDYIANVGIEQAARLDIEASGDIDDEELPLLLPLPDGRLLRLPFARLRPVLAPLFELFTDARLDEDAGTLRVSRRNASDLALLEAASAGSNIAWSGGEAIRILGRQLRDHGGLPPCAVPPGFNAVLRPYQQQGLDWLQFLRSAGLGGVLADDMGLGKTVQALAHLALEQVEGHAEAPSLVICPTSLVENWRAECQRFAPNLCCLVLHGADRASRFEAIGTHDVVVTTYPLLARDHAVLLAQDWHVVVLDEAQTIKNPQASISKLTRTLKARQRLCLSGTPLENHLGELWSLFDFLMPGFLGDRRQFGSRYRGPIEKGGDHERQALLARRIAPFLLRRTKEQVAPELPAKTEITETVTMGEAQRALYEGIRLAMHAKVRAAVARRG
ncbi:MAG: SNF2-related protein, partial [Janthinobacterium lividum]